MKNRQNGTALVEFALILPLMLVLTFITTEFGRAMYQYNTLTKSVRDAVRYASVRTPNTQATEVRNLVVYGNPGGTGSPLALGLTLANVPAPIWQTAGSNPVIGTVTVQITGYAFNSLFPGAFGLPFGNIPFSTISATMRSPL